MAVAAMAALAAQSSMAAESLHTVFCAECTSNFDWKSAGVYYTHRISRMPGKITRLLACTEKQKAVYPKSGLEMGPTFVHPNYLENPHNGESSGSYNKPASVMHWVREANIAETFVLFIDADMLLRAPIDPVALGVKRGLVVSEHVHYLDNGIRRHLPENFLPDAAAARFAKAAGWYHIFHLEDLRAIAPRWLHYCERMRTSPQLYWDMNGSKADWHPLARAATVGENFLKTGDDYVKFGEAPWISEMYGYVMAASEQHIDTKLITGLVEYTDYHSAARPPKGPTIIHYGLHCHVDSYHFTKYHYTNFHVGSCPKLFFRAPNVPKDTQALCAETINTLNDALCDFYRSKCPGAEELQCAPHVSDGVPLCENTGKDCASRPSVLRGACSADDLSSCRQACTKCCGDREPMCLEWAFGGECDANPGFMRDTCKLSCHQCATDPAASKSATSRVLGGLHTGGRSEEARGLPSEQTPPLKIHRFDGHSEQLPQKASEDLLPHESLELPHDSEAQRAAPDELTAAGAVDGGVEQPHVDLFKKFVPTRASAELQEPVAEQQPVAERKHRHRERHRKPPSETQLLAEVGLLGMASLAVLGCVFVLSKRWAATPTPSSRTSRSTAPAAEAAKLARSV